MRGERAASGQGMKESVYLQTFGCQMNERDAEEVLPGPTWRAGAGGMLAAHGYARAEQPEQVSQIC